MPPLHFLSLVSNLSITDLRSPYSSYIELTALAKLDNINKLWRSKLKCALLAIKTVTSKSSDSSDFLKTSKRMSAFEVALPVDEDNDDDVPATSLEPEYDGADDGALWGLSK